MAGSELGPGKQRFQFLPIDESSTNRHLAHARRAGRPRLGIRHTPDFVDNDRIVENQVSRFNPLAIPY